MIHEPISVGHSGCHPPRNSVVNMDSPSIERFRINGLGNPWDATVDLSNGDCWIVARGSARAFRFSATGKQLASVPGLGDPFQIRLDPGQ